MIEAHIYVEGKNDRVFLCDYLEEIFGLNISVSGNSKNKTFSFQGTNVSGQILLLEGWGNLNKAFFQNQFNDNTNESIKNIVIVDADKTTNGGSFGVRKQEVDKIKLNASLVFEYFLIPNDQQDGYLETALREILVVDNKALLDCLDSRDACLQAADQKISRTLKIPPSKGAEKSKLNQLRVFLDSVSNYKDNTIWNLNHPYLNPLKEFLSTQLGLD
ncbi:MAG: hypothetical protein JKY03_01540 [Aureispira sp.]|nr:hypothetical protein [Aureispira sp.]